MVGPNGNAQQTNAAQRQAVPDATKQMNGDAGTTQLAVLFGSGFAVVLGISSFVAGLLGWLLVMKKRVLQCSLCGAVVNAS
jgi:hypothetical protein